MQRSDNQQAPRATAVARMATGTVSRREFLRRVGLGGLGVLAAGGLLTSSGNAAYARSYDGAIFPGVTVAGVALGGLTTTAARERLAARFAEYSATSLPVGIAGAAARWQIAPASLGASADLHSAIAEALAFGRQGGPLADLGERFGARLGGSDLPLSTRLDGERLVATLRTWAPEVTGAPTDAAFADGGASGLTIVPDRAGRGLDPDGSQAAFLTRYATLSTAPVELPVVGVPAAITAADLEAVRAEANALVASPLILRVGERTWPVEGPLLRAALVYRRAPDGELEPGLRAEPLRPFLSEIAATIATPAADARIAQDESGRYRITAATPGAILDESGTVAALGAALREGRREASVALTPQAPQTTAADLEPAFARLDAILNTPLVVAFEEFTRTYDRATIAPLLVITPRPATTERIAFSLDETKLAALIADLAKTMDQEPRDARFKWVDGAVQDVAHGQDGRTVQLAPTQTAIAAAILGATGRATPVVTVTKPAVPVVDRASIVIRDRLGRGQTNYYGGVANRVHNVELSASRLDGALIPPNGIFSFNDTTGAQTLENGYKQGYGIALVGGPDGGKGNIKTVPSIGGGVCQVSTTLFQAVYAAGLPIEERNWHSLWLMTYDPANSPTAKKGLDATVDDQSGLDFRFQNTTGGWLAVEAIADGATLKIALIGVDPGWQVQNDEPIITNIKPADPAPVYEKTHNLPPGEQLPVESAVDGFDAANRTRVLDKNGTVLRDKTFTSNYAPSRNVIQIGVPPNEPLT